MQMAAKIVYYGPGLCGKTTNLSYIYAKTSPSSRGEMVSLETESDRTLFFDLLPIEVGTIGGFKTRLQLYTVPGQVFYNTTRKLVLKGVDGLVFVADSQRPMREANLESLASLADNLAELGLKLDDLPLVLQYNKRDLKSILTVEELDADLNPDGSWPSFESCAINGDGVFETLKEITKLTLKKLRRRMASPQKAAQATRPSPGPVRPSAPQRRAAPISAAALARAAEEGVGDAPAPAEASPPPLRPPVPAETAHAPEATPADRSGESVAPGRPDDRVAPVDEAPLGEPPPEALADEPAVVPEGEPFGDGPPPTGPETVAAPPPAAAEEVEAPADATVPVSTPEEPAAAEISPTAAEEAGVEDVPAAPTRDGETDPDMRVDFDRSQSEPVAAEPPPLKRVQVSNQMDILAELEGLRKQATMSGGSRRTSASTPELDLDSLLGGAGRSSRELRRHVEKSLNSDVFRRMRGVRLALVIEDGGGQTIHTLEPVSMQVDDASQLRKLSVKVVVDLENLQ